jgi:hypothetical protein
MEKDGKATTIPALKNGAEWVHQPRGKAQVFAETFASKFVLSHRELKESMASVFVRGFRGGASARSGEEFGNPRRG